jgi:quercetin dioxygenase-like cupin family protein
MDAVVYGRFRLVLEGQEVILDAGDILAVPRGIIHSAEVMGDEPLVSLDAVESLNMVQRVRLS